MGKSKGEKSKGRKRKLNKRGIGESRQGNGRIRRRDNGEEKRKGGEYSYSYPIWIHVFLVEERENKIRGEGGR